MYMYRYMCIYIYIHTCVYVYTYMYETTRQMTNSRDIVMLFVILFVSVKTNADINKRTRHITYN